MGIMNDLAERLERAVIEADAAFGTAEATGDPNNVIRLYVRADEEYERLDKARKAMYALLERISRSTIPELMLGRAIRTIALEDIKKRITVSTRISCSIIPEKKVDAFSWLRAPEQSAEALIQETVNAGTLSSYAKQRVEQLGVEMPEDKFKMSSMQFTSVTSIK